ncbi:cell division protein FtsL [Paracoccus sp. S-4012]|uniref:cell division protein FtsL n=1 Tax=Paracoccus sp. S-4012 TaxID=2665648 RepID=UPI0012B05B28|nr:cell division protein FtsL [Paracoccus sp. S-4012]MRX51384.1 cell division protein FtsL [Paracoccus sp. S-4012]
MRTLMTLAAVLVVMGLAFWAYRENYRTQAVLSHMESVQRETAGLRERLGTLNAEWAYLNRPERLSQLANRHFEQLQLLPVTPGQLLRQDQIAYPMPRAVMEAGTDPFASTLPRPPGFPPLKPRPAPETAP